MSTIDFTPLEKINNRNYTGRKDKNMTAAENKAAAVVNPDTAAGEDVIKIDVDKLKMIFNNEPETRSYNMLQKEANQNKADREKFKNICSEYQQNIKTSSGTQTEILKGLRQCEDIHILFLKACKVISAMTGNPLFYNQVSQDVKILYGKGLGKEAPLKIELSEVEERLKKLQAAAILEIDPDEYHRIKNAISEHEKIINALKSKIAS